MRRRVYGEEIAAEPSQFLNELPLELVDDLSYGSSWLSYARGYEGGAVNRAAAASFDQPAAPKPKNLYTGKTYNSAEAIAEFFAKKGTTPHPPQDTEKDSFSTQSRKDAEKPKAETRPVGSVPLNKKEVPTDPRSLVAGSHVRHEKYGRGLVLRREGNGDNVKLTISFPGFGQKKLIEKFAKLQKVD